MMPAIGKATAEAIPAKTGIIPAISSKYREPEVVLRPHQQNIKPATLMSASAIAKIFMEFVADEYMITAIKNPTTEAMPAKNGIAAASSLK